MEDRPTPHSELERAFDALVEVTTRLVEEGGAPRAAAVKTRLQRDFGHEFEEERLGFPTFRSFLQAAEKAGRVELRDAPRGPDLDVLPPGTEPPPARSGNVTKRTWIRRDLWDAFTRWDEGFIRFWDPDARRAVRLPEEKPPGESEEDASLREAWESDRSRFVPIEHIPVETVVGWAREFTGSLPPDPAQVALLNALEQELPIHNFTQLVRRLGLSPRWHEAHSARVREVVEDWARRNGVEIDLHTDADDRPKSHPGRTPRSAGSVVTLVASEDDLRRRVHDMVDRMTLPELLDLSIPLRLVATAR